MKYLIFLTLLSLSLVFASEIQIPENWNLKDEFETKSVQLYKKDNENLFAIVVNMNEADLRLGIYYNSHTDNYNNLIYESANIKDYNFFNSTKKYTYYENNTKIDNLIYSKLFATISPHFFRKTKYSSENFPETELLFPLKSNGEILNSQDLNEKLSKKTLYIDYENNAYINENYDKNIINNKNIRELIVGLDPYITNSKSDLEIGRSYIAGIKDNKCQNNENCNYKYIIFFISQKSTQYAINQELEKWNLDQKSIIMMNTDADTQLSTNKFTLYGKESFFNNIKKTPCVIFINGKK